MRYEKPRWLKAPPIQEISHIFIPIINRTHTEDPRRVLATEPIELRAPALTDITHVCIPIVDGPIKG